MRFKTLIKLVLVLAVSVMGPRAFAKGKSLIEMKDGKPTAALATAWKKLGEGKYEFTLDPTAELVKGKKLTPALVKTSLEEKLGSSNGVKVTPKGATAVAVTYTGDEKAFLEKLAKTKIRAEKNVELALASSGSSGGIRAKSADRAPAQGEVKGTVVGVAGETVDVRVVAASKEGEAGKITAGKKVKLAAADASLKKGDTVFFKPTKLENEVWQASAVTKN